MNLVIIPRMLSGNVAVPSSKSLGHRYLFAAACAEGESVITSFSPSADLTATVDALRALGAVIEQAEKSVHILRPVCPIEEELTVFCNESGSTLRFIIPLALSLSDGAHPIHFTGRGKLLSRPLKPYFDLFDAHGIRWELTPERLTVQGALTPGDYTLPGNVSSQFITGLLYALPRLNGDSTLTVTDSIESGGYLDLTAQALEMFGVHVPPVGTKTLTVKGNQAFLPRQIAVEGDYSQAAFFFTANELGSSVGTQGLNARSKQGDRAIVQLLEFFRIAGEELSVSVRGTPDLAPALAVAAAFRNGKLTRLTGCERLRMKESDRVASTVNMLLSLGASVREQGNTVLITGTDRLPGGTVDCCNDHRIAMAAAIAATRCEGPVTLIGAECVEKSYPGFWEDYRNLGGQFMAV